MATIIEYRWASETGMHSMITVDEAEYFGYEKMRPHPYYPKTWLMYRKVESASVTN